MLYFVLLLLNSNLTSGIKVDYFTLSDKEYTPVTSSKVLHTTFSNRKFSDYEYINIELLTPGYVRDTKLIPRRRFSTYSGELTYVNSANVQFWCNVAFASDTTYYVQGSSNLPSNAVICITGQKALM